MFVCDDQLDPAKATVGQSTQELVPEHFGLAGLDGNAQNLAPSVYYPAGDCAQHNLPKGQINCDSHYGLNTDSPPGAPDLDVGGVQPEVGPFTFQRSVKKNVNTFVDLDAQARDLALGDASHAHRFHQIID